MKKTILNPKLILIVLMSGFFYTCSTISENVVSVSVIEKPIESIDVNKNVFIHTNSEGSIYETPKGTVIIIPKNSLVYENGEEVKENVEITFNEFHTMADIALSGIPMQYDTNGVSSNFISGGMFTIKGKTVEGETVKVKKDAQVEVKLASNKEENYNFYELNEETGDWSYVPNSIEQIDLNKNFLPIAPEKTTEDDLVLDLNIHKYNEEYEFNSSMWKLTGNVSEKQQDFIRKQEWSKYAVTPINEKNLQYKMVLSNSGNNVEVEVTPVLSPSDMKKCKEKIASEITAMQKDLESDYYKPRVVRNVRINGFGTYNCDVYQMNAQEMICNYSVDGEDSDDIQLFQFDLSQDMLINVGKKLSFNPESKNVLIGLLPNDEVVVFTPTQYQDLNSKPKGSEVDIVLSKTGKTIKSADDLYKIVLNYI